MSRAIYLMAHTNDKGVNVAQATILARSEAHARDRFARNYPQRIITAIGIRGEDEYSG